MMQSKPWSPSDIVPSESDDTDTQKRRGRIPQSAWPGILERYKAGATLSALAREFNCTPSAISYIVRKAEAAVGPDASEGDRRPEENNLMSDSPDAEAPAAAAQTATPVEPQRPEPAPRPEAPAAPREGANPRSPEGRLELRAPAEPRPPQEPRFNAAPRQPQEGRQEGRPPNFTDPRRAAQQGGQSNMRLQLPNGGPPTQAATAFQPPPPGDSPYHRQQRNPAREEAVEAPAQPPDQRMAEAATSAADAYREWKTGPGQEKMQTLADALHDLRKVIARMEIEVSASRREENAARPIPIPMHRAAQRS